MGTARDKLSVVREDAFERIRVALTPKMQVRIFCIIASAGVRAEHGLAEAMARARSLFQPGADRLYIEAPQCLVSGWKINST